jgi:hypothetical protein
LAEKYYTELGIFSDKYSPDQITKMLNLNCDFSKNKGDRIGKGKSLVVAQFHIWAIYSRIPRSHLLEDHIIDLLNRIRDYIPAIKDLSEDPDIDIGFNCVVHSNERPILNFTKEQVADIAALGAEIDIDFYYNTR